MQESLFKWLKKVLTGLLAAVDNLTLLIKVVLQKLIPKAYLLGPYQTSMTRPFL